MWHGGVAGVAVDDDVDARAGGHDGAGVDHDGAGVEAGPVVVAEDALHGEAFEQAVLQHGLGAAAAFFGGLEDKLDGASPGGVLHEQCRGAEQAGGVAVMAAGVHDAGGGGGVGEAGGLGDGQRVHVGAEADAAVRGAAGDGGNDAVAAHVGDEGDAQLG